MPNVSVAFPHEKLENIFGEYLSKLGMTQLRIAETEKYAHVTFFFNGGQESVFPGEDRCLIPSPKVATYDLKPEMSAPAVTDEAIRRIESGKYDVIILNFANCDMVGHTGVFDAAVAGRGDRGHVRGPGRESDHGPGRRGPDHRRPRQRRANAG